MSEYGAHSGLNPEDLEALRYAARLLENPGFFIRSVNLIGAPIDAVVKALPAGAEEMLRKAVFASLERAFGVFRFVFSDSVRASTNIILNDTTLRDAQ